MEHLSAKDGLDIYRTQVMVSDFESWLDDEASSKPPGTYSTDVWLMTTVSVSARNEDEAKKQVQEMIDGSDEYVLKPTERTGALPNNAEGLDIATVMKADWNFSDF
jgi:hypothetical protein